MDIADTTLICPQNDAESFTIIDVAKRLGYETRISAQHDWFCPLDREPEQTFHDLKPHVITVEMPGLKREKSLQREHFMHIIDHHDYASLHIHRDHPKSSLEQFADLTGYELNREEMGIAINDQKYIYGLVAAGYTPDEIQNIRKLDLQMQGYTDEDFRISEEDAKNGEMLSDDATWYRSSLVERFSYLLDLHVLQNDCQFSDVAVTGKAKDQKGTYIFFSGGIELIRRLRALGGYSKQSNEQYGLWGGFENGIEQVNLAQAMDMIRKSR